jgi:uncharacterized protein YciI
MNKRTFIYKITPASKDFLQAADENGNNYMALHFGYLQKLLAEKVLVMAGPCLDAAFGIAIFYCDSEEEAAQVMNNDPAVKSGIVNSELHEFKLSLLQEGISPS